MEYKQNLRSNEKKGLMDAIAKAMEIATPAAAALPLIAGAQEAQALDVQNENNLRKDSTKVRKDNSQNNPTKGYIAGGFSAFKDYFGATQFDTFLGGGLKIKPGDFLIFDTIDLELVTKPYSYEDQTHTTELGFEGSIGVSKNMPTGLDRLMRQFAEGLKYALDLKGGSRKFYSQERLEDLFQLKDLRPDLMNLNYLQLGLAGGYGEKGFQILGYIDIPILGTWDEAVGFKEKGDYERLTSLLCIERGIPRHGCEIQKNGQKIGTVTSGTLSPCLNKGIAMGYLKQEYREPGTELDIIIRDKPVKAEVVKPPFVSKDWASKN